MQKNEWEFEGPERGENQATKKELDDLKEHLEKVLAEAKKGREQKITEYFEDKDGCKIYYKDLELARKLLGKELLKKKEAEKINGVIQEIFTFKTVGYGYNMAYLHEHCYDCKRLLGNEWKEVHEWLDALFAEYGPAHRCHRHHVEGVEEIRKIWGDEAAIAAKIHILVDCWGIPSRADYENGWANSSGFTVEATLAEAKMMLQEIVKK